MITVIIEALPLGLSPSYCCVWAIAPFTPLSYRNPQGHLETIQGDEWWKQSHHEKKAIHDELRLARSSKLRLYQQWGLPNAARKRRPVDVRQPKPTVTPQELRIIIIGRTARVRADSALFLTHINRLHISTKPRSAAPPPDIYIYNKIYIPTAAAAAGGARTRAPLAYNQQWG